MSYYAIKNRKNNEALDIQKGGGEGTKVITYKRHNKDNQLWYDHEATGTIRSKLNDLCLEQMGHHIVVGAFKSGRADQQWERYEGQVRNRRNNKSVIGLLEGADKTTGNVGVDDFKEFTSQLWDFDIVAEAGRAPPSVYSKSTEFYIVSEKNGKVLEVQDVMNKEKKMVMSTPVMASKKYPAPKSQLWYTNVNGDEIHSSLNDHVIVHLKNLDNLVMAAYRVEKNFQWKIDGKKIINGENLVLDIRGDKDTEGADLCAYKYTGAPNQHWLIVRI